VEEGAIIKGGRDDYRKMKLLLYGREGEGADTEEGRGLYSNMRWKEPRSKVAGGRHDHVGEKRKEQSSE
jgi:hypothetical protein